MPEAQPKLEAEVQSGASAQPLPVVKTEAAPKVKDEIEPKPAVNDGVQSEIKSDSKANIAKLMNMSLGELLLTAMIKDPESAGRIVAQAISQAEGP